jgi:steroid delta-isomerase-like uncharacterized protein
MTIAATTPPEVMDEVLERHFAAEAAHDVEGILATLTEDCEHDVVGWPTGPSRGYEALVPFYERLFSDLRADKVTPVRRHHGPDLLVDEVLYEATAIGEPFGFPGNNRPVSFRLLHVCEFRDGRISRENVWIDFAAIAQQLA